MFQTMPTGVERLGAEGGFHINREITATVYGSHFTAPVGGSFQGRDTTPAAFAGRAAGMADRGGFPAEAEARLEALIDTYRHTVFARALRLTRGDAGWAEDVVQETFLRAWRHWERLTPERGSVRGWLMQVAHNLVMDGYRSARVRRGEVPLEEAEEVALSESTDEILTAHLVHTALRLLPDAHRRALEATYLNDQTAAQAAHQLDVPVGTVKSRVYYGLRMLRSIMDVDAPSTAVVAA